MDDRPLGPRAYSYPTRRSFRLPWLPMLGVFAALWLLSWALVQYVLGRAGLGPGTCGAIAAGIALAITGWIALGSGLRVVVPTCNRCGQTFSIADRWIGVPIDERELALGPAGEAVRTLARGEIAPLERAAPYETAADWMLRPALFLSLGRCEPCNAPYAFEIEVHGRDGSGRAFLGIVHRDELAPAVADRLIEVARRRGLVRS